MASLSSSFDLEHVDRDSKRYVTFQVDCHITDDVLVELRLVDHNPLGKSKKSVGGVIKDLSSLEALVEQLKGLVAAAKLEKLASERDTPVG